MWSTKDKPELLDVTKQSSLTNSQYNPKHTTKIIIHGFGGGRNYSPSTDLRAGMRLKHRQPQARVPMNRPVYEITGRWHKSSKHRVLMATCPS
ncbi:Uncharacterized protein GBIM_06554 [Gryllus bimaculatus]|nr:Uncharacterized protein GBIM_06554 [Gryllus bimaculatus]